MKTLMNCFFIFSLFVIGVSNAQIETNQNISFSSIPSSSAFLDASVTNIVNNVNLGKGLIFPRANLTTLTLANQGTLFNASNNPNRFDGMIVYNTGAGNTVSGQGITTAVSPGFYYFSNPLGTAPSASNGQWLPLGGSSVKEAVVTKVVAANNNTADVDLATATLVSGTLPVAASSFIEAKVYDNATGRLVLTADGYNTTTNVLTTGNGFINQVLAPGTYRIVVSYK